MGVSTFDSPYYQTSVTMCSVGLLKATSEWAKQGVPPGARGSRYHSTSLVLMLSSVLFALASGEFSLFV